jgi:hypothetical protein
LPQIIGLSVLGVAVFGTSGVTSTGARRVGHRGSLWGTESAERPPGRAQRGSFCHEGPKEGRPGFFVQPGRFPQNLYQTFNLFERYQTA